MNCYYCDRIRASDPDYTARNTEFDLGSEAPRCAWHWRFMCDCCGLLGHFMSRFYCPSSGRLLCGNAGSVEFLSAAFWAWYEAWWLHCPDCGALHPSLDRAEYDGVHPWDVDPAAGESRRWLSPESHLVRYPRPRLPAVDYDSLTDADSDSNWSRNADIWETTYDDRGDANRRYSSDPVLLRFLGDVAGKRILDAGSGGGYLSRMLARLGARMIAVENAERFHEIAIAHHVHEQLDIEYHHASISAMPFIESHSVDAAVANYVLMDVLDYENAVREIARVLKPGARFVFTLTHTTTHGYWNIPALDSPRRDDRAGLVEDNYFVRGAGYTQWGSLHPVLGFDRPLRDYIATCRDAGLELRDLEEPELSDEGRRMLPPEQVRDAHRVAWSWVISCEKTVS